MTGLVVPAADGRPERALAFTFVRDRIAVIEILTDPARLDALTIEPGQGLTRKSRRPGGGRPRGVRRVLFLGEGVRDRLDRVFPSGADADGERGFGIPGSYLFRRAVIRTH